MRRLVVAVATLLGVVAVVGGNPAAAQAVSVPIKPQFFGMHDPGSDAPRNYGAVRWWDNDTTWADVEPAKGLYNFTKLDRLVDDAEHRGVKATLTLGATPSWAATNPTQSSAIWLSPGSSSPPRSQTYWTDYVTAVATRYAGRIDSYQIWNEGGLPQFWSSTPAKLAQLTAAAYVAIKEADPHAKVVSSPILPRQPHWQAWATSYLKALRQVGWPVDVFAIHSYQPDRLANPDGRALVIQQTRDIMRSVGAPSRALWDTETNYTSRAFVRHKITGARAAAWVARAYLDSLRLNVRRTFWYAFNRPVPRLGVTMGPGRRRLSGLRECAVLDRGKHLHRVYDVADGLRCDSDALLVPARHEDFTGGLGIGPFAHPTAPWHDRVPVDDRLPRADLADVGHQLAVARPLTRRRPGGVVP